MFVIFSVVLRCGQSMSSSLSYLKPLRNSNTFLHIIYKSKKKTNLLCILNNVFQYSKIRTRKQNAKKSIITEKNFGIQPFLESGIHWAGIRNPVLGIRNPQGGIQNPGLSWIPLHGAIHKIKTQVSWHQSEARTAATVWSWSGNTLSPGALLAVLYFSSCHIFPSVSTFPRPNYLPLGLRGWYCEKMKKVFGVFWHLLFRIIPLLF